jgi:hypothetical protein
VTQLSICLIGASDEGRTYEAAPKPIPSVARDASYLTRSAGVKTGRTRIELPLFTQLRTFGGATLPTANLAASRIFFKQLANRHDAHAVKSSNIVPRILSPEQNYECGIGV